LTEEEKVEIDLLMYNQRWAFHAYNVQEGETDKLKDLKIVDNKQWDTRAILGYDNVTNSIITSFRGSIDMANWILDADFIKTEYTTGGCNGCEVHAGFKKAYESIQEDVIAYVQILKAKYPEARVVVTGHSLGAAESMLGAVDQ
jgi:hypothetical protein